MKTIMESWKTFINEAKTSFEPEPVRREPEVHEYEIMKGRGDRQKWFYVDSADDAKQLVRLGRGHRFPTGITRMGEEAAEFDDIESYMVEE